VEFIEELNTAVLHPNRQQQQQQRGTRDQSESSLSRFPNCID